MLALCEPVTGNDCGCHAAIKHPGSIAIDIVKFEAWHLDWLNLQASQARLSASLTVQYGRSLEVAGPCYSAFAGDRVIACAGIVQFWEGRAQVWSLLSESMPTYKKAIHRAVKCFLKGYRVRRLECVVDPRSESSMRWAEHLGFHMEHSMTAYTPDGDDQIMYVRLER